MLTWNTFRDHTILEYEIPKWDGDLSQPNVYHPGQQDADGAQGKASSTTISARNDQRTGSTRRPSWVLARLRGAECRAPDGFAEAFHARKMVVQ